MKLYFVQLTCDHDALVLAHTPEGAFDLAEVEAHKHGAEALLVSMDGVYEVDLDEPRLVALVSGC